VAILGGSGCGKSTLLKIIGGQLRPEAGAVTIEGKNVHELDPDALYKLRLEIGMMFQTSGLFSDLSVYENIAFPIRENFDVPEDLIRRLVLMKLHAVGLRGAHAMKPNDLSGGMTRRVALARAIATDPKLMMYDEPFAGLDPISLNQIVELIRRQGGAQGGGLRLRDLRRGDPRQGHARRGGGLRRPLHEAVPERAARRAGALPLSRPAARARPAPHARVTFPGVIPGARGAHGGPHG
jgi:ABC-type lipoprotein export system ATPase subunit